MAILLMSFGTVKPGQIGTRPMRIDINNSIVILRFHQSVLYS